MEIRNLSVTLQCTGRGRLCRIITSTHDCGPIEPSGSITEYLFGAVDNTAKQLCLEIRN